MTLDENTSASIDLMLAMSGTATVAQGLAVFETVGMASRNLSPRTRVEYRKDLEDFQAFLERRGVRSLGGVFLAHLEAYQAEMDSRGYAPATRRRKCQLHTPAHADHGFRAMPIRDSGGWRSRIPGEAGHF